MKKEVGMKRNGFKEDLKIEIIDLLKQIENKNPNHIEIYSQDGLLKDFMWYWYFGLDNLDELLIALIRCYRSKFDLDGINFNNIFDKIYKNFERLKDQEVKELFYPLTGDNRIWYLKDYEPDYHALEDSLKEIGFNENQIENILDKAWSKFNYDNFYSWLKQEYELKEIFKELIEEPSYEHLYYVDDFFNNLVCQETERKPEK